MRTLLIASAVAIVVVAGISLYANSVLKRVHKKQAELNAELEEQAKALRALDGKFSAPAAGPLRKERFTLWLEVRTALALALEGRFRERADDTYFHGRETQVELLRRLARELEARKMCLAEYRAISERWKALLALPEFDDLRLDWAEKVRTSKHPKGPPLPAPAKDASKGERALARGHAEALETSASADLLLPLLEEIAAG